MAQSTRQPRQTRSSAACDSCRSKKQKCGGEWPTCARCRETGNECTWPPQLQRGPAKGYLEAIEARLDDVEHILLQILPLVPSGQLLNSVTCHDDSPRHPIDSNQKRSTQEKRAALDYWASFPLNSPHAVLAWYHDRLRRESVHRPPQPHTPVGASASVTQPPMDGIGHPTSSMARSWSGRHLSDETRAPATQDGNIPGGSANAQGESNTPQHVQGSPSLSPSASCGGFDLSEEFHVKFLW